ncbi:MAG: hypothetical protein OXH31_07085 [Gammaproteobacteria bacterium]|nr:hypothetical protein [Gammaproteobacteria bacterium]
MKVKASPSFIQVLRETSAAVESQFGQIHMLTDGLELTSVFSEFSGISLY